MAINVIDNFNYKGSKPLDARIKYDTVAAMASAAAVDLYDGCWAYVTATKKYYSYDSTNDTDPTTGKWREYSSGGEDENVEITKAQFDALPAATKNNGQAYFIPDANLLTNFTVMGNRFDKANIYDTSERMVGRWIDGKPIYQIVKQIETLPKNTGWSILDDNFVVGTLIVAVTIDTSNRPLYNGGQEIPRWNVDASTHKVTYSNSASALSNIAVVFQYTKTTDASVAIGTENDYSTDEMIIGTWIDGKPIYQKTITGLNISGMSWNGQYYAYAFIPKQVENVDTIINHVFYDSTNKVCIHGDLREQDNPSQWQVVTNEASWVIDTITIQYTKTTD